MHKNFLNISDFNKKDLEEILETANRIENKSLDIDLNKKKIGLIFEKPSTRTRLSFISGIHELSGIPIEIDTKNLNLSRNESFIDTVKMFNLYLDCIILRTNDHNKFSIMNSYFDKTIINALSDVSHPCQILSDYYTLIETFDRKELDICWFGDFNNVLYSLIDLSNVTGSIKINIFTDESLVNRNFLKKANNVYINNEISKDILSKTDCVMTDVFTSMNDNFDQNKKNKLMQYQVNSEIMKHTNNQTVFMHCLPANIGEEVTEEVITSSKSIVLKQAYNRKVIQKGLISWLNI